MLKYGNKKSLKEQNLDKTNNKKNKNDEVASLLKKKGKKERKKKKNLRRIIRFRLGNNMRKKIYIGERQK